MGGISGRHTRKELYKLKKEGKSFRHESPKGYKSYYVSGVKRNISQLSWGQARTFRIKKTIFIKSVKTRKTIVSKKIAKELKVPKELSEYLADVIEEAEKKYEELEPYKERKAYVVWYGGKKYEVRYEIYVEYWAKDSENPEALGNALLRRAVPMIFDGVDFKQVKSWHGSATGYVVTGANSGAVSKYENNQVRAIYSIRGRDVKFVSFTRA